MREISLEQVAKAVAGVGAKVARHRRDQEHAISQQAVLICAVGALVQTHPDGEAFAKSFRQCWKQFGSGHQLLQTESPARSGLAEALSMLEALCGARLSVRPPGQAEPPVQEGSD